MHDPSTTKSKAAESEEITFKAAELQNYQRALKHYQEELAAAEPGSANAASIYSKMGALFDALGNASQAREAFLAANQIWEKNPPLNPLEKLPALRGLAGYYVREMQSNPKSAFANAWEAKHYLEPLQKLGENKDSLTLAYLGDVYRILSNHSFTSDLPEERTKRRDQLRQQAQEYYKLALSLGSPLSQEAYIVSSLGLAELLASKLATSGDDEVITLLENALRAQEKLYGEDNCVLVPTLEKLSQHYEARGKSRPVAASKIDDDDLGKAVAALERAFAIAKLASNDLRLTSLSDRLATKYETTCKYLDNTQERATAYRQLAQSRWESAIDCFKKELTGCIASVLQVSPQQSKQELKEVQIKHCDFKLAELEQSLGKYEGLQNPLAAAIYTERGNLYAAIYLANPKQSAWRAYAIQDFHHAETAIAKYLERNKLKASDFSEAFPQAKALLLLFDAESVLYTISSDETSARELVTREEIADVLDEALRLRVIQYRKQHKQFETLRDFLNRISALYYECLSPCDKPRLMSTLQHIGSTQTNLGLGPQQTS